jgi:transcriptional regulator with XRE-family HTH domain
MQLPSLADRIWYAYHCLPRDQSNALPSFRQLENAYGLSLSTFSRAVAGVRENYWADTIPRMAEALRCTAVFLTEGQGRAPKLPIGYWVPPRPGPMTPRRYRDVPGWDEAVEEARRAHEPGKRKALPFPPEGFLAGGDFPLSSFRTTIDADAVIRICHYVWWDECTDDQQKSYAAIAGRDAAAGDVRARHLPGVRAAR